jgi:hypothetical protein|tara:strand:+ start:5387 stop:5614 length:228 start_codon:yes stop_codon:yes gene_type:complete
MVDFIKASSQTETSAETMSRCVSYFKDRLHEETQKSSYKQYWRDKYDKIELTDYANKLIDKYDNNVYKLKGKSKQ